jgi:hypothetical protein
VVCYSGPSRQFIGLVRQVVALPPRAVSLKASQP